jgi:hypothetical protein
VHCCVDKLRSKISWIDGFLGGEACFPRTKSYTPCIKKTLSLANDLNWLMNFSLVIPVENLHADAIAGLGCRDNLKKLFIRDSEVPSGCDCKDFSPGRQGIVSMSASWEGGV